MYVLVRSDLDPSQVAVQSAHAVLEAARQGVIPLDGPHPHLVLLDAGDEADLLSVCPRLDGAGIRYAAFIEPDLNEATTAVATEPLVGAARKLFKTFRLWKAKELV